MDFYHQTGKMALASHLGKFRESEDVEIIDYAPEFREYFRQLNKARELGAKRIFVESNTVLAPAINLCQKLGFRKVIGPPSAYARCNIQMELLLQD